MNGIFEQAFTDLELTGAHVTSVQQLLAGAEIEPFDRESTELFRMLDGTDGVFVPTSFEAVFSLALSPGMLALMTRYLRRPPALTGVHARRDIGPEVPDDLRCWHLDSEDERMARVIIYLHDVDIETGPFEFIPRPLTAKCEHLRHQSTGDPRTNPDYRAVDDAQMRAAVPEGDWVACTGPRHTAAMADTAGVFHHTKPHQRERRTLTLSYTSRNPRFPTLVQTPGEIPYLTTEQRASLFV